MNSWIRSRAIASSCSQIVLDPNGASVLFSSMGGVSFLGRIPRLVVADQEGYAAFSSFTHLSRVPPPLPKDQSLPLGKLASHRF